jgi:tetratricopeptide (TPR) repeat protein
MPEFDYKTKLKRILLMPIRVIEALMRWLAQTSEKFERSFKGVTRGASRFGDAATQADSIFSKFFSALLSPLVWIWRRFVQPVFELVQKNPIFQKFGQATYWLWYPALAVVSFCRTFLQTRSKALLIWSLPFLIIVGGTLFLLWTLNPRQNAVTQKYREAIEDAISKGEFQQAALYQQKLQSLGIRTEQSEMKQIEDLVKAGKLPQAIEMAERLATLDKPGFPEAHFWLARVYFEEQGELKGIESLERCERHLSLLKKALQDASLRVNELPPTVVFLSAMVELKKNNVVEGVELLKSISDQYWPALVLLLETNIKLQRYKEAQQVALKLSQAVKKSPEILNDVSAMFFPMWCAALAEAGDREETKVAVNLWHQKFPEDPNGLNEWASLQLQEIDTLMVRGNEADMSRATNLFIQTTNRWGNKGQPFFSTWLMERLPPKLNSENYLKLAELSAQHADVSGTVLEVLGTAATLRGEQQLSLDLLKRATEKEPENSTAWNNLAFVANSYFENEMPLAIEAVNKAAQIQPDNPEILHTRGFIRIKLKQYDLAIEDLRQVIAKNPAAIDVHQGLAQAYRAIGKTELAAFHEQLAQ